MATWERLLLLGAIAGAMALLVAGCTDNDPDGSNGDGEAIPTADDDGRGEQDADAPDVLDEDGDAATEAEAAPLEPISLDRSDVVAGSEALDTPGLMLEVVRLERIGEGLLAFDWQLTNTSDEDRNVNTMFGSLAVHVDGIRLVADQREARPFRDEDDFCLCVGMFEKHETIPPGASKSFHSFHADPGADTLTVLTREFGDIEDVPVTTPAEAPRTAGEVAVIKHAAVEGVRLELSPLERFGEVAVLRATVVNDSDSSFQPAMMRAAFDFSFAGERRELSSTGRVSFIDLSTSRHHRTLNSNGWCLCESRATTEAGERRELTWIFHAPAAEAESVALSIPFFGAVPALPVIEGSGSPSVEINGIELNDVAYDDDNTARLISRIEEVSEEVVTRAIETGGDTTDIALASDVLFDVDSDELRADAQPLLDDLVATLEEGEGVGTAIMITGHTDWQGAADYNQALSERRAESVLTALLGALQRDDLVFEVVGLGETDPIADNLTEEGRQRNRRVTVSIPTAP